jgi:lysozyme
MQTSIEGLIALIGHEGIVLSRYRDSVGVWTIGVGHTKAAGGINPETFTGKLSLKQVFDLLREDIRKYEEGVNRAVKVALKQHEFDALVSFHFNTGAIAKATLTKSLNAGDKALAAKQFMNWVTPKEITARRMAERDLFLTGKYPPAVGTVYPATPGGKVVWRQGKRVHLRELLETFADAPGPGSNTPAAKPITPVGTPKPALPAENGTVTKLPPDNSKLPAKNVFLAWLLDIIQAIFGRK